MDFKVTVIVVLLQLAAGVYGHPDVDDRVSFPSDIGDQDVFSLAQMGFSATSNIPGYNENTVEEQFRNRMEQDLSPEVREIMDAQNEFADSGSVELEADQRPDVDRTKASIDLFGFYQHTCPYRFTWIPKWRFYFYYRGKYCWHIYPVWYTVCGSQMCNLSFTYPWWWWNYYRCFPDYRYIYAHFWCAQRTNSADVVAWDTSLSYLKIWVSRGCSCRKYWKWFYLGSAQCPAQCLGTN